MLKVVLVLFAAGVFAAIAFTWITGVNVYRWEAGAAAAFVASFLPFPDYPVKRPNQ